MIDFTMKKTLIIGDKLMERPIKKKKILIIGDKSMKRPIKEAIEKNPLNGYQVSGFMTHTPDISQKVKRFIDSNGTTEVLFTSRSFLYNQVTDIIINCSEKKQLKYNISTNLHKKIIGTARRTCWIGKVPSVDLSKDVLTSRTTSIIKRMIDIVLSIIMLAILSPLLLLVCIAMKLTTKGPIIFTQIRAGINGRPFKVYKFRTMVNDAEERLKGFVDIEILKEPVFKFKRDSRVTPLGRILRKTSIDELPQIFNVLKGDMSWVGPRPEEVRIVKRYKPYFKERLKMRPGITGLQQIRCRGNNSMTERMKYDMKYIEDCSLWFDLRILIKSVYVVLLQKGVC